MSFTIAAASAANSRRASSTSAWQRRRNGKARRARMGRVIAFLPAWTAVVSSANCPPFRGRWVSRSKHHYNATGGGDERGNELENSSLHGRGGSVRRKNNGRESKRLP